MSKSVQDAASAQGRRIAATASTKGTQLERATALLERHGYEPRRSTKEIVLANRPFDSLVQGHMELVCRLNQSLIGGALEGLGCPGLEKVLAPEPGRCCVKVRRSAA
ncbi:MAG: hypothetical protein M3130_00785 [Actinomycetota bacterium]|nr:hypothetical protein [Actinomycetota bacterium]